jgi:hypothetical protein
MKRQERGACALQCIFLALTLHGQTGPPAFQDLRISRAAPPFPLFDGLFVADGLRRFDHGKTPVWPYEASGHCHRPGKLVFGRRRPRRRDFHFTPRNGAWHDPH